MSILVSNALRDIAIARCRGLRKQQTKAEEILWQVLRGKRFCNLKARRQHPVFYEYADGVSFYIADFYINCKKLIIEIDGEIHRARWEQDAEREDTLLEMGYKIIRFTNEDMLNNIKVVKSKIIDYAEQ